MKISKKEMAKREKYSRVVQELSLMFANTPDLDFFEELWLVFAEDKTFNKIVEDMENDN